MEDDKIFELMTKMYAEMTSKIDNMHSEMQKGFDKSDKRFDKLESDVKKLGAKIDGDITPKLKSLFDGYKQNSEQLNRIEKKVTKHDDVILRRVK